MDKPTRNLVFNTTQAIRRLLEEEFALQLEGTFDVNSDGPIAEQAGPQLTSAERLVRQRIVDAIRHCRAAGESDADSVRGYLSEAVFTFLNRLAALKMMEARGLILPCVSQGDQSQGFKEFSGLAPGLIELPDRGYRLYLECLFDEIGREVGVLFDRTDSASQLWPRRKAMEAVLEKLNVPALAGVWAEDETIGWIYQYYNDPDERKKMRDESSAPRNSRELAVRNQFFTPRYVVEFLTDNTLGRLWYDMTRGETRLTGQCRYFVRRPNEIFLELGKAVPQQHKEDNLSQEELLQQPVFISHRQLKDPRTILMLDPACGSMHFGLYAFDLFEVIYDEAWELEEKLAADALSRPPAMKSLRDTYADKAAFLKDVPKLIIEHNIHGIDIDPRAVQIAGLALWLRAQKVWQRLGLKPAERPAIRRSNIVCAEPMPGEKDLLPEFVEREFPAEESGAFLALLTNIFDKMRLAGEAGSLLKIEDEIRSAIQDARQQWQTARQRPELFDADQLAALDTRVGAQQELPAAERASTSANLRSLTSEDFLERIEERIYGALRDYAEQAENGGGFQRRLFAEDAARGFAFIDVCRKRYDATVMNPPFGDYTLQSRTYLDAHYQDAAREQYAAFIGRAISLSEVFGLIGAITSRTGFFIKSLAHWRHETVLPAGVCLFAELGEGVLDAAVVGTAAYILGPLNNCDLSQNSLTPFIRLAETEDRGDELLQEVVRISSGHSDVTYLARCLDFASIPDSPLAYWLPRPFITAFKACHPLEGDAGNVRVGLQTGDDFRFIRLFMEVSPSLITAKGQPPFRWVPHAKGGDNSPFYADVHLLVNWACDGKEIKSHSSARPQNADYYFKPGLTFPYRVFRFSPAVLPLGCITGVAGMGVYGKNATAGALLAALNTDVFNKFVSIWLGRIELGSLYQAGTVQAAPLPNMGAAEQNALSELAREQTALRMSLDSESEMNRYFVAPMTREEQRLASASDVRHERQRDFRGRSLNLFKQADAILRGLYGLHDVADEFFTTYDKREATFAFTLEPDLENSTTLTADTLSYCLGCALGRWDIRFATGEHAAPELPDPFAPLPACPPGQLQNAQGLPASPEDVPAAYPVHIPWGGILVDDPNHPEDIERRVREVIGVIWKNRADAMEQEACALLGVKSLREYFRKPAGFFADHLKRYSKSRRQAPIYWPLSSPHGLYTVWLYYHRLTADTLFTVLRDYVKPKLEYEERRAFQLTQEAGPTPSPSQRGDIAEAAELVEDLRVFRDELNRVAPLFRPNLNDGVIINHAPLWRMAGHNPWQKKLKECWDALVNEEYDWAHLAMNLWPERVVPKCGAERSLAITHGLDEVFWEEIKGKPGKWVRKKVAEAEVQKLIAARTSPAVKNALESLSGVAVTTGQTTGRRAKSA